MPVGMVVDWRADHSLRIPRPDLSIELGTPNPFWTEEPSPDFGEPVIRSGCGNRGVYCATFSFAADIAGLPSWVMQNVIIQIEKFDRIEYFSSNPDIRNPDFNNAPKP